jgi:hypothetical protein
MVMETKDWVQNLVAGVTRKALEKSRAFLVESLVFDWTPQPKSVIFVFFNKIVFSLLSGNFELRHYQDTPLSDI